MRIRVQGGFPLNGQYQPAGNANSAIAMLAASLLTEEPVTLRNVPDTTSTAGMMDIARVLGTSISIPENNVVIAQTPQILRRELTKAQTGGGVGTLLFLAPVLVRRQYAHLELDFPLNRIRAHIEALRSLGQDVVISDGGLEVRAHRWEYKDIILVQASVTATAMVLMLAACFGKETIINNAASEPHVQELARMLEKMGAQIQGVGSNVLHIFGADHVHGIDMTIGPDHIETASVAAMGALCGGRLQVDGIRSSDLRMIDMIYRRLGVHLDIDQTMMFVPRHEHLVVSSREEDVDSSIETAPWPGFPSDLVAIATVIATQTRGTSLIHEKMFNDRLLFVDKLNAMGAQIVLCDPHRAIVVGPTRLRAIYMDTPDVRTGLGMLCAALIAQGETIIDNAQTLRRSFDGVVSKLRQLGAQIEIESSANTPGR